MPIFEQSHLSEVIPLEDAKKTDRMKGREEEVKGREGRKDRRG